MKKSTTNTSLSNNIVAKILLKFGDIMTRKPSRYPKIQTSLPELEHEDNPDDR